MRRIVIFCAAKKKPERSAVEAGLPDAAALRAACDVRVEQAVKPL